MVDARGCEYEQFSPRHTGNNHVVPSKRWHNELQIANGWPSEMTRPASSGFSREWPTDGGRRAHVAAQPGCRMPNCNNQCVIIEHK